MNFSRAFAVVVAILQALPAAAFVRHGARRGATHPRTSLLPASAYHFQVNSRFSSLSAGGALQSTPSGSPDALILPASSAVPAPESRQKQAKSQAPATQSEGAAGPTQAGLSSALAMLSAPLSASGERIPLPKDCEHTAQWGQLTVHRSWGCFDSVLTGERRRSGEMLKGGHAVLYFPELGDNRSVIGAGHAVGFTAIPHWGWGRFMHVGSPGILTTNDGCRYEERIVDEFGAPVPGCDPLPSGYYGPDVFWAVQGTPGWNGGAYYRATVVPIGGLTTCMLEPYRTYFYTITLTRYEQVPFVSEKLCGTTLDAYDESWLCALPETNGQGACAGSGVSLYGAR